MAATGSNGGRGGGRVRTTAAGKRKPIRVISQAEAGTPF